MNRRKFLKSAVALGVIASLPIIASRNGVVLTSIKHPQNGNTLAPITELSEASLEILEVELQHYRPNRMIVNPRGYADLLTLGYE